MDKQRKKHDHRPARVFTTLAEARASVAADNAMREQVRAEQKEQAKREVPYRCAWNRCTNFYDPLTNRITWGYGAIGCPCDHMPGWDARHPLMLAKPAWPAKSTTGRNGSRVQRSRRRHRGVGRSGYMKWAEEWDARKAEV